MQTRKNHIFPVRTKVRAIAFDFGGVYFTWNKEVFVKELANATKSSELLVQEAMQSYLRKLHVQKISEKEYWALFCKRTKAKTDWKLLQKITDEHFKPIHGMKTLIRKLRTTHTLLLLTNFTVALDRLNKKYDFYKEFDHILSSHIVKCQKPEKEMFDLLKKKTGFLPQEILFIDDYCKNIDAAQQRGLQTILFTTRKNLLQELKKRRIM